MAAGRTRAQAAHSGGDFHGSRTLAQSRPKRRQRRRGRHAARAQRARRVHRRREQRGQVNLLSRAARRAARPRRLSRAGQQAARGLADAGHNARRHQTASIHPKVGALRHAGRGALAPHQHTPRRRRRGRVDTAQAHARAHRQRGAPPGRRRRYHPGAAIRVRGRAGRPDLRRVARGAERDVGRARARRRAVGTARLRDELRRPEPAEPLRGLHPGGGGARGGRG
mmetsp:Transcript_13835/g.57809  ORF Transcript_13835/g.57809 Transcript_13835/m.57809 type:complete len:225 (-) Transcript_13835:369-1043(-)